ncbi:unnamed protein product, partial [Ectocarpus sp. 12 AP-2014]
LHLAVALFGVLQAIPTPPLPAREQRPPKLTTKHKGARARRVIHRRLYGRNSVRGAMSVPYTGVGRKRGRRGSCSGGPRQEGADRVWLFYWYKLLITTNYFGLVRVHLHTIHVRRVFACTCLKRVAQTAQHSACVCVFHCCWVEGLGHGQVCVIFFRGARGGTVFFGSNGDDDDCKMAQYKVAQAYTSNLNFGKCTIEKRRWYLALKTKRNFYFVDRQSQTYRAQLRPGHHVHAGTQGTPAVPLFSSTKQFQTSGVSPRHHHGPPSKTSARTGVSLVVA